jgi:hypothetical protein
MIERTPTPWYATTTPTGVHVQSAAINEDNYVANVDSAVDAARIVRSANAHDDLLAALKEAHAFLVSLLNMRDAEAADALGNNGEDVEDTLFFAIKKGEA